MYLYLCSAESLPKEKEVKEKQEETNQDKSNQRAWIMQYMEEKSSSEDVRIEEKSCVHNQCFLVLLVDS